MKSCKKVDLHIHTVASGHAFSTLNEIINRAREKQMSIVGISDHGPSMAGAPVESYFNMKADVKGEADDINILFGCEANILSEKGELDLHQDTVNGLDYILAGLHEFTPYIGKEQVYNTSAIVKCIEKEKILCISHPISRNFPVEEKAIVEAAASFHVALEINNRVFRGISRELVRQYLSLLEECKKINVPILLSSDSHVLSTVGEIGNLKIINESLEECSDLILNLHEKALINMMEEKHAE